MKKKEKLIILGHSGSGKDFLMRGLIEIGLVPCLKLTTRPMRSGEKQGVNYEYLDINEFKKYDDCGDLLTNESFEVTPLGSDAETWYYGITRENFEKSQVLIVTTSEYKSLLENSDQRKNFFVVYLDIDRKIREDRLYKRKDNNDSIKRRLDADEIDFGGFNDYDLKITDPEFSADDVYHLMD